MYDSVIGRFITPDSIVPKLYDPQSLNRYAYARNNPLKYNDPDGHAFALAVPAAIAAFEYAASTALGVTIGVVVGGWLSDVFKEITVDKKIPNEDLLGPPSKRGNAPIGKDGHPVELHHPDQKNIDEREELSQTDHRGKGNYTKNHPNVGKQPSEIDRNKSNKDRKGYWGEEMDRGRFEGLEDKTEDKADGDDSKDNTDEENGGPNDG